MTTARQSVTATASPSFQEDKEQGNISIERCSSGRDQETACTVMYRVDPPGVMKYDSVEPGCAVIRLWYPEGLNPELFISGAHSDKPKESLGRRREKVVETLTFNGSSEATISKPFSASGLTVLATSVFIGKDGSPAAAPIQRGQTFRTSEPAYGAIVVEYEAAYDAYRIYYGLPEWVILQVFQGGRDIAHVTIPPVMVMAFAKGHAVQAQIERRIMKVAPPDCKDDDWDTDTAESIYVEYKTFPDKSMNKSVTPHVPKPNADYLTTRAYIKHVEYCKQRANKKRIHTFPDPKGDNILVIGRYNGAI